MLGHRVDVVGTDGAVTQSPPETGVPGLGGFAVVEVSTRDEAQRWAARIAVATRTPQQVRELIGGPPA